MRHGKMKTLHGLYKKLGRDLFLEVAKNYSDHVHNTIDATLNEMECRWFDREHTITEGDKMVADYNKGRLIGYDCEDYREVIMTSPAMKMEVLA